jgi:bifunctional non-homologous end joining protein LigD
LGVTLQRSGRTAGLIEPCLPSSAKAPPPGSDWLHEIKHDGFRILALRDAAGVQLYTRNGNDFTKRFLLVVAAVAVLPVRSCVIDGEAIVSYDSGLAVIDLIRALARQPLGCALRLRPEVDGEDLRRLPIEQCKRTLASLPHEPHPGIALNTHYVGDGDIVYRQACKLGCEGIVSKRLGSPYRSGRSRQWVKIKNPAAPAVRREAEEEWR